MEELLFYIIFPALLIMFLIVAIILGIVNIRRKRKAYTAATIVLASVSIVLAALVILAYKPHHLVFEDGQDNILGIRNLDMDEKGIRLAFDIDNECSGLSSFSGDNLDNDVCNMFLDEFYSGDFVVSVNGKEVEGTEVRIDDEGLSIVIPKPYAFYQGIFQFEHGIII